MMMATLSWRIAAELREAISDGTYPAGTTLPAITDLMGRYGCARDTVRDAISNLAAEGLVTSRRGIGTIVREVMPVALAYDPSKPAQTWAQQLGDQSATDVVVSAEREPADPDTAERLRVAAGTTVVHRVRHQSRGGGVAQIHEQWIPETIIAAITEATGTDLADATVVPPTDLFTQMRSAGYDPSETTETIGARMPDPEEREVMGLPGTGVPVLITRRVTRGKDGQPVETSTMIGASDRMTQTFTMSLH
jgi:GntR family transcriptional regulator